MNDWRAHGACRHEPTGVFFPRAQHDGPGFDQQQQQQQQQAIAVCAACPVIIECRQWAIPHELYGVWGGTTERERKRLRKRLGIPLRTPNLDNIADDSWKPARAVVLWRQRWKLVDIAIELHTNIRQVQRWLTAEGVDAIPPPMGGAREDTGMTA